MVEAVGVEAACEVVVVVACPVVVEQGEALEVAVIWAALEGRGTLGVVVVWEVGSTVGAVPARDAALMEPDLVDWTAAVDSMAALAVRPPGGLMEPRDVASMEPVILRVPETCRVLTSSGSPTRGCRVRRESVAA
jgi:hypothetical protein